MKTLLFYCNPFYNVVELHRMTEYGSAASQTLLCAPFLYSETTFFCRNMCIFRFCWFCIQATASKWNWVGHRRTFKLCWFIFFRLLFTLRMNGFDMHENNMWFYRVSTHTTHRQTAIPCHGNEIKITIFATRHRNFKLNFN